MSFTGPLLRLAPRLSRPLLPAQPVVLLGVAPALLAVALAARGAGGPAVGVRPAEALGRPAVLRLLHRAQVGAGLRFFYG